MCLCLCTQACERMLEDQRAKTVETQVTAPSPRLAQPTLSVSGSVGESSTQYTRLANKSSSCTHKKCTRFAGRGSLPEASRTGPLLMLAKVHLVPSRG